MTILGLTALVALAIMTLRIIAQVLGLIPDRSIDPVRWKDAALTGSFTGLAAILFFGPEWLRVASLLLFFGFESVYCFRRQERYMKAIGGFFSVLALGMVGLLIYAAI